MKNQAAMLHSGGARATERRAAKKRLRSLRGTKRLDHPGTATHEYYDALRRSTISVGDRHEPMVTAASSGLEYAHQGTNGVLWRIVQCKREAQLNN